MMTKNKNKKSMMNMLRKMSMVPVALIALYLFACNSEGRRNEGSDNEDTSAISSSSMITQTSDDIVLFALVDEKPMFNGKSAEEGFREWVMSNTVYPAEAQEKSITGRVYVQFIIDTDGSVNNVKLLRGTDPLLDAEALRVIKLSPKWTPGKHEGKMVKVQYVFPFLFQLNN